MRIESPNEKPASNIEPAPTNVCSAPGTNYACTDATMDLTIALTNVGDESAPPNSGSGTVPLVNALDFIGPPMKRGHGRPRKDPRLVAAEKAARKPAPRTLQREESRERLRGAASVFPGLSEALREHIEVLDRLRNIRRVTNGYQVLIHRGATRFARTFGGFSPEHLARAMQARDEALALLGCGRSHLIPEGVLRRVGLAGPMTGITRFPKRSVYRVEYRESGRSRIKLFYFRHVPEADAYAAAVAFADEIFTAPEGTRKLARALLQKRDPQICEVLKQLSAMQNAETLP